MVSCDHRVIYEGEEVSISALSAQLKGYKVKYIASGPHWVFCKKPLDFHKQGELGNLTITMPLFIYWLQKRVERKALQEEDEAPDDDKE